MPKQVDADLQRRAIAEAAIRVIGDAGLDGTRLRDVARAAQVTTGAVTHYFDSKDAVLLAALEEIVRRILDDKGIEALPLTARPVEAMFELACSILPLDADSRREWRVWLAFWGRAIADERLRTIHRDYYARIVGQLAEGLSGAPDLSPEDANRLADAIVAAVDGVGTRATLEPELWPPARQRETLSTLILPLLVRGSPGQQPARTSRKEL